MSDCVRVMHHDHLLLGVRWILLITSMLYGRS